MLDVLASKLDGLHHEDTGSLSTKKWPASNLPRGRGVCRLYCWNHVKGKNLENQMDIMLRSCCWEHVGESHVLGASAGLVGRVARTTCEFPVQTQDGDEDLDIAGSLSTQLAGKSEEMMRSCPAIGVRFNALEPKPIHSRIE